MIHGPAVETSLLLHGLSALAVYIYIRRHTFKPQFYYKIENSSINPRLLSTVVLPRTHRLHHCTQGREDLRRCHRRHIHRHRTAPRKTEHYMQIAVKNSHSSPPRPETDVICTCIQYTYNNICTYYNIVYSHLPLVIVFGSCYIYMQ